MDPQTRSRNSFVLDNRDDTNSFISEKPTPDNHVVDINNQKVKLESLEGEVAKMKKCTILLVAALTMAILALLFLGVLMASSGTNNLEELRKRTSGKNDLHS